MATTIKYRGYEIVEDGEHGAWTIWPPDEPGTVHHSDDAFRSPDRAKEWIDHHLMWADRA